MRRLICVLGLIGGLLAAPTATAGFDEAMAAYRMGDYKTAFEGFLEEAKKGDSVAQHNVAVMYYHGEGTKRNLARAYAWMTLAVQGDDDDDILRAHHVLMILSDPKAIAAGQQLARSLAKEHGLKFVDESDAAGLRVVSGN